jgi:hypothetical protein
VRLPFPENIPFVHAFFFALTLCVIQQVQGTNPVFSLGCFAYILVATLAFNLAGGFTRTSGAYIFFNSVLGVIIGLCVKVYLDEAADSNLLTPLLTIGVYLLGMCMMLVAVFLSKKVRSKRALMGKMVTDSNMQTATVGCLVAGILMMFAGYIIPGGNGSVLSALNQLNRFFPLAIILGVINTIRRSGGNRSINMPVVLAAGLMFTNGVLGYSKEGMLGPFAAYVLAAASQRYRVSRTQIVVGIFAIIFIFQYLVPYAQYGRNYRDESGDVNLQTSLSLLSNLGYVRQQYLESSASAYEEHVLGYYNTPQGFFDRLQMISIDDALNYQTQQFGTYTYGLQTIVQSLENLVPHFIWADKPHGLIGNVFAHEVGILAEADESTGVSFSSTATAFHIAGWKGIFILAPSLWFFLFLIFDSLCGDIRKIPWGLLVTVLYAHAAPEGDVTTVIYMCFYTTYAVVFAAVMGAYVMPILGTFFIGPEGIMIRRGKPIRSIPNRLRPPVSPAT